MVKEKKRIWIVNQYAGSPAHGMEFRHYYLAKEFIKNGHEVWIISGSYSHLFKNCPQIKSRFTIETIDEINYCWVKIPEYKKSISIGRIYNMLVFIYRLLFISEKLPNPGTIIISSPSLFPVIIGRVWSKKYKAKLIFEVRDLWPLTLKYLGNLSSLHPLMMFMQLFENYAYKYSDYVVSVLSGSKNYMIEKGLREDKFFCIPNGIDLEELKNIKPLAEKIRTQIPSDKFIVGYAGAIGKANALEYLIDSAFIVKNNSQIHFVLVGNGDAKQKLIEKANGLSNITFIETIDKREVQSMLSFFDINYIGWHKEKLYAFGISANKLYDYMFSGKPILHSVETNDDIVKKAKCGISVEPENPHAISTAILKFTNMSIEERKDMGQNGKQYVLQYHTYEILAKQYIELF